MKAEKISNWVKVGENLKDGDIVQILEEGEIQESEFKGKQTKRFVTKVKLTGGEVKSVGMNSTSFNNLIDAFGDETKTWIGKDVKAWVVSQNVSGEFKKVLYFTHPNKDLEGNEANL